MNNSIVVRIDDDFMVIRDETGVMADMPSLHIEVENDGKIMDLYNLDHDLDAWVLKYGDSVEYLSSEDAKTVSEYIAVG